MKAGGHHLSTRVGARPLPLGAPPCLLGPLMLHRPQLQLHIFCFTEKKIREKVSFHLTPFDIPFLRRGFFRQYFLYIPKIFSVDFQVIPRTSISAQK